MWYLNECPTIFFFFFHLNPLNSINLSELIRDNTAIHIYNSYLERVLIPIFAIVALHNLAVDTKAQHVVADLVVVGYGSGFGLPGGDRLLHGFQSRVPEVQTPGRALLPLGCLPAPLCKPSQHFFCLPKSRVVC